jgi:hypothetical protein
VNNFRVSIYVVVAVTMISFMAGLKWPTYVAGPAAIGVGVVYAVGFIAIKNRGELFGPGQK